MNAGQESSLVGSSPTWNLVNSVSQKVAPVWPLRDYVAVNPFLGFATKTVPAAAAELGAVAGTRLTMPRTFYRQALEEGVIQPSDLERAAARLRNEDGVDVSPDALLRAASEPAAAPKLRLPTVTDDVPRLPVTAEWVVDYITAWASGYFDRSLALWPSPWSELEPWDAFCKEVELDTSLDAAGVGCLREALTRSSGDSLEFIERALDELEVPPNGREDYLHRLASSVAGWCGLARQRDWHAEGEEAKARSLCDVLAVRTSWELALLRAADPEARDTWHALVRRSYAAESNPARITQQQSLAVDVALQWAYEHGRQRQLLTAFNRPRPTWQPSRSKRVQAVFCIDVRSEIFRRALERAAPQVETLGFAGFFGFPIAVTGAAGKSDQCPVLLSPPVQLGAHVAERGFFGDVWASVTRACRETKGAAVASFTFVEALGATYVPKLWSRARLRRMRRSDERVALDFESLTADSGAIDVSDERLVAAAHNAIKGMSLGEMAPLVLLVGHEAVCENNPHAAGLHCGACGGHSGAVNAQFAARVLNDDDVRRRLEERGCRIPVDTWFVAAVHQTTTDEVTLFDIGQAPEHLRQELGDLTAALAIAGETARAERERVRSGHTSGKGSHAEPSAKRRWFERSSDWSEPRPELGLAGCQAFVIAPPALSRGMDFGGRAFLHSYDWGRDEGFGILEAIMTAPMVVTNWINLQYFASTVDPEHYGCGNKVLHNVVGNFGVLEGRGGDLRVGLSLQSIAEGEHLFHDPVKLNVFIAAPTHAISRVLEKHDQIRALADNGWLYLWALSDDGRVVSRYDGQLSWSQVTMTSEVKTAA